MHRYVVLLLLPLLTACGGRQLTEPEAERTAFVRYTVEGTYASCVITHHNAQGNAVIEEEVRLPWQQTMSVTVRSTSAPFEAVVRATCTDPNRVGKSTATVYVDALMMDQGAATGPGNTSQARAFITFDS